MINNHTHYLVNRKEVTFTRYYKKGYVALFFPVIHHARAKMADHLTLISYNSRFFPCRVVSDVNWRVVSLPFFFLWVRYPEDRLPSFLDNKASMMDDLEKQDWPVDPDDINLLEKEIQQAQTFLLQSKDLRQKSEEVKSRADDVWEAIPVLATWLDHTIHNYIIIQAKFLICPSCWRTAFISERPSI